MYYSECWILSYVFCVINTTLYIQLQFCVAVFIFFFVSSHLYIAVLLAECFGSMDNGLNACFRNIFSIYMYTSHWMLNESWKKTDAFFCSLAHTPAFASVICFFYIFIEFRVGWLLPLAVRTNCSITLHCVWHDHFHLFVITLSHPNTSNSHTHTHILWALLWDR